MNLRFQWLSSYAPGDDVAFLGTEGHNLIFFTIDLQLILFQKI